MAENTFNWKLGGPAGFGIKVTGEIFARVCALLGLHVYDSVEYPSLIRGGHNTYTVRAAPEQIFAPIRPVDLLVALNEETVTLHWEELTPGAGILYDGETIHPAIRNDRRKIQWFAVPFERLAKENGGQSMMRNTVALGATMALLGVSMDALAQVLNRMFGKKGEKIVQINVATAKAGYEYVRSHFDVGTYGWKLRAIPAAPRRMLINGSQAIALGAVKGGCSLYIAYPMTPSTPVLEYLSEIQNDYGMLVRQQEDEIAVINMAIGASFAGVRSMVGTSGGGFSLMVEALGLAGMTETPLVVMDAQRGGPATGLPTWTEQADLLFVLHAAQGEFLRVVLAPGDREECFVETARAFNLADILQTPVILLTDLFLNENHQTEETFDQRRVPPVDRGKLLDAAAVARIKNFRRYQITKDGISPRTIPGTPGGIFLANSDEHDEHGFSDESAENRAGMHAKRLRKLAVAERLVPPPTLEGPRTADVTLVCWGSTKGPVREAMKLLASQGIKANMLHIMYLSPFPTRTVQQVFARAKKTVLVENNATGQLGQLIRMRTGRTADHGLLKYDGRPFEPQELASDVRTLLRRRTKR